MEFCMNEVCIMEREDLPAHIRACAAHGIRHMEVRKAALLAWLRSGGTLEAVRRTLEETGVTVHCLNALEAITFHDSKGHQELTELAEFLFYCCRELNIPYIELIASFGVGTEDRAAIKAETVRALRELSDLARPYGVKLALEYMGLPGSSVVTFSQALEIIRETDRDNVGLLPDTWHHYAGGSAPEDILQARAEEIFIVHTSDCPAGPPCTIPRPLSYLPGNGVVEIGKMIDCLRQVGYEGVFSVEVMDPALRSMETEAFLELAKEKTLPLLQ